MSNTGFAVIRPCMSKKHFWEAMILNLKELNLKEDAIESIDFSKIQLKYLLGYQYKGDAECTYSCRIAGNHDVTINKTKHTIKAGTPIVGNVNSSAFDIAVPCVGSPSPAWVEGLLKQMSSVAVKNTIIVDDLKNIEEVIGDNTNNPLDFWVKHSNDVIDNLFSVIAYPLASNSVLVYEHLGLIDLETAAQMASMGVFGSIDIMNFNVKSRNNLKEYGQKVLIPCYVLEFKHDGKDYFIAAGISDEAFPYVCRIPKENSFNISPEEQAQKEMPEKFKIMKFVKWGWILAVLALFTIGFTTAVVCLAAWGIAKWYFSRDIKSRIKTIEDNRKKMQERVGNKLSQKLNNISFE